MHPARHPSRADDKRPTLTPVLPVPRDWNEITPAWMTAALARTHPGAVVEKVAVCDAADGTNRRARIELVYERGEGPPSVFVKAPGRLMHRLALSALRAVATEAQLAELGLALPIEHPEMYAGGYDRRRIAAIVVMEDITNRGSTPNEATRPLTPEEVEDGLDGLAGLHAAYWENPPPFFRPWKLGPVWAPISGGSLYRGLRRLPDDLMPAGVDARTLEREFRRSAISAASGPQTVLHGDPHPGNTYALAGNRTGFYDWQLVRRGNWSHDVGYFVAGSLSVEDRREHERDLLSSYLNALRNNGAPAPEPEEAWDRYRMSPPFGLATWLHTLSGGSFQPRDVCLVTIERFAAAYADLKTI